MCTVQAIVKPISVPFRRRFNFSKANWDEYTKAIDEDLCDIPPCPNNYDIFVKVVRDVSRRFIPRGCRISYVPGLTKISAAKLAEYEALYVDDPFSEATISAGEEVMEALIECRRNKWMKLVESIDMTHNSKKAWCTLRKLTSDPPVAAQPGPVTANQVAHQLLLNGKPPKKLPRISKIVSETAQDDTGPISQPFTVTDIIQALGELKNGKANGIDDITVEQLKHLGPIAISWLLQLFNNCIETAKIPKKWRKAKVVALLKPGKPVDDPKSYRPISLLCHTYKLLERLLLRRLTSAIDDKLNPDQAGFRPGRSCCGQVFSLTQHIEDGFERGLVTGAVFVDLTAAYDTVNIKRLLAKVAACTKDLQFVTLLGEMLRNRRFQVLLNHEKSRWRNQKNGLPQGSVLAPILFNIYTDDQPGYQNTSRYIYADDLALTCQAKGFPEIEEHLSAALDQLGSYYESNSLRPNPAKTESCAFHLRNRDSARTLRITWRGVEIAHNRHPKYLGVTLDRSLTYKANCERVRSKVSARNNIVRRLTNTQWGAAPHVLRTSCLALCYSAGEYACPVWARSTHARDVDVALNESCRMVTGSLKPTPLGHLYSQAGIAPPSVRRQVACSVERQKQVHDSRHPLYGHIPPPPRLRSRRSFIRNTKPLVADPSEARIELWKSRFPQVNGHIPIAEKLPAGKDLPWPIWKSLNRLRSGVGRCGVLRKKWGYASDDKCICGVSQTMEHLLVCPASPVSCTQEDLVEANQAALDVATFWAKRL